MTNPPTTSGPFGTPTIARPECWVARLDGDCFDEERDPHSATEAEALKDGRAYEAESREDIDESDDPQPRQVTAEQIGPCYELRCAACEEPLRDYDEQVWLHFGDASEAETCARDSEWVATDGVWRCNHCSAPDADA